MIEKIKQALNNSVVWFLGLLAAALFFWKKERDLEKGLEESKASGQIKELEGRKREIDEKASSDLERLNDLIAAYHREHLSGSGEGEVRGSSGTSGDSDSGSAGSDKDPK